MIPDVLLKSYLKADQFLVDRASEAVKAWNWTTGRTRAELADVLNVAGNILAGFGHPSHMVIGGPHIICFHYLNNGADENDRRKKNGDALHEWIEDSRFLYKISAPAMTSLGILIASTPTSPQDVEFGLGGLGVGLSSYVMRADYQAPRKNVLARAKDKLEEMARNWQPLRQPIPETARTGGYE
jgi:hypothetical protein